MSLDAIKVTTHQFISFDETPIYYQHVRNAESPKAIAIIIHGMGEHGARYRSFAEYLAGLGLESYIPDLRGFGKSGGKRAYINSFSDLHKDLEALHAFVARTHKEVPIVIIGHSFGGLVASSYLAFCRQPRAVQGLALSSPIFGIAVPVPFWRHCVGVLMSYIFPSYSEATKVDPGLLTHDREISERYAKDDLIFHRISARLYRELRLMLKKRDLIAQRLNLPVLVLQAGEDFVVSKDATVNFYDQLKTSDKELEVYKDFYHEILNETGRDQVYSRIGLWILNKIDRKPLL